MLANGFTCLVVSFADGCCGVMVPFGDLTDVAVSLLLVVCSFWFFLVTVVVSVFLFAFVLGYWALLVLLFF